MSLDDLLKPLKPYFKPYFWLDEQVLRQYTKLTQKNEEKGIGKYAFATRFNTVAKLLFITGWFTSAINENWASFGISLASSLENTYEIFLYNPTALRAEEFETFYNVKDPYVEKIKPIFSKVRLPILAGGISQIGMGLTNLYNYFFEGDGSALPIGIQQMVIGTGLLSWSSAMYVRDSDPKILEKQPFWKTAYNWAREKYHSLKRKPIIQPVPT